MKKIVIFIFFIFLIIALSSCNFNNSRIRLWTNRVELAAYIELFNTEQDKYRVEIIYCENPIENLFNESNPPDLIICENIADSALMDKFDSLNDLFTFGSLRKEDFYKDLLELGEFHSNQYLIPVNFNLPLIIFKKDTDDNLKDKVYISIDYLREKASEFNVRKGENFKKMGFSPLWSPIFLYNTTVLFGTDFTKGTDYLVTWNQEALKKTVNYIHSWIFSENEDFQYEKDFNRKYLVIPSYQLIQSGSIKFYLIESDDYFAIPKEKREKLDFRLLSFHNKIPVLDNILYLGVLSHSRNKSGARSFVKWLFNRDTQINILKTNHLKRFYHIFGIANGFSTLKDINEKDLCKTEYYPLFLGFIPTEDKLLFPNNVPVEWLTEKKQLFLDWLKETVVQEESDYNLEVIFTSD